MDNADKCNKSRQFSLYPIVAWFLVLWTLLLTIWMYNYSVRNGGVPCWDGYDRCSWAASIYLDVINLDLTHFAKHTNEQRVWPFLHSWITGGLFLLFGPSLATARILSLFSFWACGSLILIWFIREKSPLAWVGGISAWMLFTFSPIVMQHSVGIMSEFFGLFLVLGTIVSMPLNDKNNKTRWVLSGIFLGLLFVYKYNFAFLTLFGIGMSRIFAAQFSIRRLFCIGNWFLFGIPALIAGLWFVIDFNKKWEELVGFAVNNPNAHMPFTIESFFFYFQRVPQSYFLNPWIGIAAASLILFALPLSKRLSFRNPLICVFLIHFAAAVVHPFKMDRFQYIPMGVFYILVGESIFILLRYTIGHWKTFSVIVTWLLLLTGIAISVEYHSRIYRSPLLRQYNPDMAPLRTVVDCYEKDDRIGTLIAHWDVNPPAVNFEMIRSLKLLQRDHEKKITYWTHLYFYKSGADVRKLSIEDRVRHLRHALYTTESNKIIVVETTIPWGISPDDPVFSAAKEYIQILPKLENYEEVYNNVFKWSNTNVRVYTLK
jgi:hypothetical protein